MPARRLFLGLDVGTQGTKGLLVDLDEGEVVARAAEPYELIEGLPPGAAEQHPDTWWAAVRHVVSRVFAASDVEREALAAIGVSAQQHGFVPVDAQGKVIRPAKLWCDTTTAEEARELSARFGRAVPTGFTASKILWLKRHRPADFARLATVLLPHDWINLRLTGVATAEAGDASGTGLFDPIARAFIREDAASIDPRLADCLPPLLAPDEPAGHLTAAAAAELGLPQGLLVAPGGGDNMLSAIGSGATRPGTCVLSLGTSATVFTYAERPVVDPEGLIAPFCDSTGGWLPLLCTMNATGVTEEVRDAFGADLETLTLAARAVAPGCDGVTFLPYLVGERVPDLPQATGSLLGLRPGSLRPGTLFRAALEGTSLSLGLGVERLRSLGVPVHELRAVGGASANRLWLEILAAVLDAPIRPLLEPESAALGAALQAAWVWSRSRGDEVSVDELSQRFAKLAPEGIEPGPHTARYRELSARFGDAVRQLHG